MFMTYNAQARATVARVAGMPLGMLLLKLRHCLVTQHVQQRPSGFIFKNHGGRQDFRISFKLSTCFNPMSTPLNGNDLQGVSQQIQNEFL